MVFQKHGRHMVDHWDIGAYRDRSALRPVAVEVPAGMMVPYMGHVWNDIVHHKVYNMFDVKK